MSAFDSEEQWRDITGYEGRYQISSLGRVKSLIRPGVKQERILKPNILPRGYHQIRLVTHHRNRNFAVHRLVCSAFHSNPCALPQVNHIDGDKSNNTVANLEWVNNATNLIHAYKLGLRVPPRGSAHPKAKLTEATVKIIKRRLSDGASLAELGRAYGVTYMTIRQIKCGATWQHVQI